MDQFFDNFLQANAAPDGPAARRPATMHRDLFADDLLFADRADRRSEPILPSGGSYAAPADLLSPAATPTDAEQRGRTAYQPFILEPTQGLVVPSSMFDVPTVAALDGAAGDELSSAQALAQILALEAEVRRMHDVNRDLQQARDAEYFEHLRAQRANDPQ